MTVSSSINRASYGGNGTLKTFAYGFKVFDQGELTVILRSSDGTETVQTITTNYTVTGVGDAGGGNVVFGTAPASGVTIVILRELDLNQGLDLVPNDPFPAQSLENSLDKLTFMVQQQGEELGRSIKASRTNVISGSEFTISATDRANKVFAFDSSGDVSITQEIGVYRGDWAASRAFNQRDIVKDTNNSNIYIANTAHTSSGSVPISSNTDSGKWDLLVNAAAAASSASAASASETAAETAETNAETAQAAAEAAKAAAETAKAAAETAETNAAATYDNFDDRYLGAKSTGSGDPTVDNDGNALIDGALFFDTTNNVMKVYNLGTTTWLRTTPTSSDQTNINTVSGISANVTTVAGIAANVTTVAGNGTNINAVAGISANVTTVAGQTTNLQNVTDNLSAIQGAAGNATAAANSAAAAANSFDAFDDKYLGSKTGYSGSGTGPSVDNDGNALVEGALYFSADANEMRVYDGANWIAASSSGTASLIIYEFTATSGQTTFSGADDNSATLGYTTGNLQVVLNGSVLDPSDFTSSNGTSIVLGAGATTGDLLNVYAFASFSVADTVSRSSGGTFAAGITVQGNIAVTGDANITSKIGLGGTNYGTAGQVIKSAGSGAAAVWGSAPAPFAPVAVTGATPSLNVGTYNYFDNGSLTANTTVSFASVPTNARWTYTAKGSLLTSAAYNLTVAVYESKLSIASQEANIRGLEFSTDGTFLYVIGSAGQDVNQYTLSTAWDVTTATHTRLLSIVGKETDPTDVTFKEDGTEMYVLGEDGDDVNQYTLSTAWDISSATFTRLFSVATQETAPTGIDFKPDGTEMYVCGKTGDDVNQYTLSTAWDISTATFTRLFSVATQDAIPNGVKFSSDGLGMFMVGQATDAVYHYTLSTAWDISSATFTSSFSVSADDSTPQGLAFSADGTRMYMAGDANNTVFQYTVAPYATLTLPSSVVDPPPTSIEKNTVSYNFTTLNGGTTVNLIDETPQSTDAGAIGTYAWGRPANTERFGFGAVSAGVYAVDSSQIGDKAYYDAASSAWVNSSNQTLLSGTWRSMGITGKDGDRGFLGLWLRIS